jgi:signal peptidase
LSTAQARHLTTAYIKHRRRPAHRRHVHIVGVAASWALLSVVVALATALVAVPKLTGSVPMTVLSGSMRPTYQPGSVVVVRPTPAENLRIGDPITYQIRSDEPTVVTHRVVGITTGTDGIRSFVTQGDANATPDPEPVVAGQVRGRVWYSVPYVGRLSTWVDGPRGELVTGGVAGGLMAYGALTVVSGGGRRRSKHGRT